jgi:hypothetical protein
MERSSTPESMEAAGLLEPARMEAKRRDGEPPRLLPKGDHNNPDNGKTNAPVDKDTEDETKEITDAIANFEQGKQSKN